MTMFSQDGFKGIQYCPVRALQNATSGELTQTFTRFPSLSENHLSPYILVRGSLSVFFQFAKLVSFHIWKKIFGPKLPSDAMNCKVVYFPCSSCSIRAVDFQPITDCQLSRPCPYRQTLHTPCP